MSTPLTLTLPAAPEVVFEMLTNPPLVEQWLCETFDIEPNVGGRIYFGWKGGQFIAGKIEVFEPNRRLVFAWHNPELLMGERIQIMLTPDGDATRLSFVNGGLGAREQAVPKRWSDAFENLQSILETGLDLRMVRRPTWGMRAGPLGEGAAKRLGIPTAEGVIVSLVFPGMAGEQAGMQPQDVIVELDGQAIQNGGTVLGIFDRHTAGDVVGLKYYRDGVLHETQMTLSARPTPEFPRTINDLADTLEKRHAEQDALIDELLANHPEAVLGMSPAENEWSVREVLAHLLFTEHFYQVWTCHLVMRRPSPYWPMNPPAQRAGFLAAYPTTPELVAALKLAERMTVAVVRSVPADFEIYKGTFALFSMELNNKPQHTQVHIEQIQRVLEAVTAMAGSHV
ncbi:MAG: hypothetical protein BroJett018_49780 [Chloroflexota bacterium]|nr:PDZ domain-containing protein [Chloroflexota bacterium]NOG64414.1 PDZ domain-containing protein [Chloroflexota bacterium]GIK67184.1 MAG: hypothetical protein BroJett018_49780 [Chloroflexota bacterium]